MPGRKHPFDAMMKPCLKPAALFLAGLLLLPLGSSFAAGELKKSDASVTADLFDQVAYEEGAQFLRLGNLFRKITFSKSAARDVNIFDEIPDSLFFTNRHGRNRLPAEELQKGASDPAPGTGRWTVTEGKVEGTNPGFFIKDAETGRDFFLEFDSIDTPELTTAAESISARVFHAAGYNVPAYHVVKFQLDNLEVDPSAAYYDNTGFKKQLTKEKIEELLLFVPREDDGSFRASVRALPQGKDLGPFDFDRRRKGDPEDLLPHHYLRSIRGLRVLASWVNHYELRNSNTLDVLEKVDGKDAVRHYLIDFKSALGSAGHGLKSPQMGHEYVFDYGEFFKALFSLGFWEKPWQKRWVENDRKSGLPGVGYFDNRQFNPGRWKSELPYHAFKNLTAADGYWAAKLVMSFTDDDISALVETGKLTDEAAKKALVETLIQRRDLIGRYWFEKSCSLENFEAAGYTVRAEDWMLKYHLTQSPRRYRYCVCKSGLRGETDKPEFILNSQDIAGLPDSFTLSIRAQKTDGKWGKRVCLSLKKQDGGLAIAGIKREL